MVDSFFQKKRKRNNRAGPSKPRSSKFRDHDEDLASSDEDNGPADVDFMDFREGREEAVMDDEEYIDENETAAEKRVRLAKGYLAKVRDELEAAREDHDYDAAEIDRELIASRLQKDVAEASGKIHLFIASHLVSFTSIRFPTSSHLPTSSTLTSKYIYTSTKRGSIIRHQTKTLKKAGKNFGRQHDKQNGHQGEILCLAASEDGKWLVSGGQDKTVGVWDISGHDPKWVTAFKGHKDAITSLAFPSLNNPSYHVFSASLSRHLTLHSLATLSAIDTFFGHQDSISSVASLKPTVAVTAGSRDRTCRWWKVEEEVQLVFRGGGKTRPDLGGLLPEEKKERLGGGWTEGVEPEKDKTKKAAEHVEGSIDVVCMLDEQHFVSGGDSGSILLWHTGKKKPIFTFPFAHGLYPSRTEAKLSIPRWITSLASLRGTNLFVSGSWDGKIKAWALDEGIKSFKPVNLDIDVPGFINSLQLISLPTGTVASFSPSLIPNDSINFDPKSKEDQRTFKTEIVLVAAVGQEPRLGRWMRDKEIKNGVVIGRLGLDERVRETLI
ncbi:uncharacterized protein L203_106328 [Cryptococcus depauperatus CBS 7841]|uniref:Uncharacterized protein n=1 Tax=Cryptococcus depauperatus CBS 7841 TaxID=1295531 RepID=A0A1E3IJ87_9TREE|nr:ribosomal RNA-processing protein 9 [Cryptococcus depauperatus CBS 7841]